ncbi:MAG: hypothetical protein AB8B73_11875 [Ekhidna sp.]
MKKLSFYALMILSVLSTRAQEETYMDEELSTYATVMVWAEAEKGKMTDTYNDWINSNEVLSAKTFLDIKNAKGDSIEIANSGASIEEVEAFETIQSKYDSMTSSFKEVYVGKIKGDIGAGLYNRLKKSLKADADVKSRYDAIYEGLKSEEVSEVDTE